MSKRRATLSNCLDLSAPHTHPSCSERQGLVPNRNDEFSEVQEPRVSNTSIAVQGPTPYADGNHIEMHSSIPNFGTGNSIGVQLAAASPMKASTQLHWLYDIFVRARSAWFVAPILFQVHFWYFWYHNSLAAEPHELVHEFWTGDGAPNSTVVYQLPHVPFSWISKFVLCCLCLLGSAYVKRIDGYLPHFSSASDGDSALLPHFSSASDGDSFTQSGFVSERLKRLQAMSVRAARIFA